MSELLHREITDQIIGAVFEVYRVLGSGFVEKVYQRALIVELQQRGLKAQAEARLMVHYKGELVGEYFADILVNDVIILELKVAKNLNPEDEAQLINELRASGLRVGLLINFGKTKAEFVRRVV